MTGKDHKYQVPAVVGAINVLQVLSGLGERGANQASLVESTGMSKSTMHNLLSTLEEHKFVRKEESTRTYRLGPALIPLGAAATRQVKLIRSTIDQMMSLVPTHALSFAVAQRTSADECQIIERVYPATDVHVGITVGSSYGPMDGALGKVLLASMESGRAEKLVEREELPAHTGATITSPNELMAEIDDVRDRGWAVSRGEFNENHAVASGIWGPSGELELLLLALGFPGQLDGDRLRETGELLKTVAGSVMAEAGCHPPTAAFS